jgi:hypothetical protein
LLVVEVVVEKIFLVDLVEVEAQVGIRQEQQLALQVQ